MPDDYEGFEQLGFRVPALIIGPWVKQGVDPTVYDHASILKYVCERFGIEPWNARIAGVNSIGEALDTERMASGIPLEPVELPPFEVPEESVGEECYYDVSGFAQDAGEKEVKLPKKDDRPGVKVSARAFSTPRGTARVGGLGGQEHAGVGPARRDPGDPQAPLGPGQALGLDSVNWVHFWCKSGPSRPFRPY